MNRKPYKDLSKRQQKRRRNVILASTQQASLHVGAIEKIRREAVLDSGLNSVINPKSVPEPYVCTSTDETSDSDDCLNVPEPRKDFDERGTAKTVPKYPEESHAHESKFDLLSTEDKIEAAIKNWSIDCPNVPNLTITMLLKHFNSFFPGIHLTAKTLKDENSNQVSIKNMHFGRYAHFHDWKECLKNHLESISYNKDTLLVNVNIDGIPLFEDSRKFHAYPILLMMCIDPKKIICVGVYLSETGESNKMPPVDTFLEKFVKEMLEIMHEGCMLTQGRVAVKINAFVCDAPVRSDLKNIVNHNSYYSCERCQQRGTYAGGHVILPDTTAKPRTDAEFLRQSDSNHHKPGPLPVIKELGISFVTSFALDYMHLVCLGVMKRILSRLKSSKKSEVKCHLNSSKLTLLNDQIAEFSEHVPSDFNRKLFGGLSSLSFWKATELRLFLLYCGIIVLEDVVPEGYYHNFLHLSLAMRLLLSENQMCNIKSARRMLIDFVHSACKLYGNSFLSYNVHSVVHLVDDYIKWGPLDKVSSFEFENYLGFCIKGRLSGRNKPLEQMCRHIAAENKRCLKKQIHDDLFLRNKIVLRGQTQLKPGVIGDRDNCIMLKTGSICVIRSITEKKLNVEMMSSTPFFQKPANSQLFGIHCIKPTGESKIVSVDQVHSKMMLIPKQKNLIAMKLLHGV